MSSVYDPGTGMSFGGKESEEDRGLLVIFYPRAVHQRAQSEREGRAIYENRVYVKIEAPGNKNSVVDREAKPEDKVRFARRWQAFLENAEQVQDGTPLSDWPILTPAEIAEYKAAKIHTVEALADVPDGLLHQLGTGARTRRDKAIAWLEQARSDKPLATALQRIEQQNGEMEVLRATVATLRDQVQELARDKVKE